jgi:hypothetical protein
LDLLDIFIRFRGGKYNSLISVRFSRFFCYPQNNYPEIITEIPIVNITKNDS